jgi:Fe-S oxidoreductase
MKEEKAVVENEKSLTEKGREELEKRLNRLVGLASSSLCVRCGLCVDVCHYVAGDDEGNPELAPVAKAERIRRVYKKKHDWLSRLLPGFAGAEELTEEELEKWSEMAFRNCTLCQRCTVNCPMGVDTAAIIGAARGTLTALGKAPAMLTMLADASIARGDNLEVFRDIYVQQIEEMEKQLREDMGDPEASIPVEVEGARFLYVPLSGAHTILPAARIFSQAGESWTLSMFEASNYGVFLKDSVRAKKIADRVVKEAVRLGVEEVIITECGHAYTTFRWTAPGWYNEPWPFKVRSLIEVVEEYIREGRLKIDPDLITQTVTLHDSCNLGRNSGLIEEPRHILKAITGDFREMAPHKERNYCCGGGSGLVAIPEWEDTRMKAGRPKAEQIKKTGAEIVVASCDNCRHQIEQLSKHYDLGVEVTGLSELVCRALEKQAPEAAKVSTGVEEGKP